VCPLTSRWNDGPRSPQARVRVQVPPRRAALFQLPRGSSLGPGLSFLKRRGLARRGVCNVGTNKGTRAVELPEFSVSGEDEGARGSAAASRPWRDPGSGASPRWFAQRGIEPSERAQGNSWSAARPYRGNQQGLLTRPPPRAPSCR